MKPSLLMLSGDRDVAAGRRGPFYYTLEGLSREFDRIDVLTPNVAMPNRARSIAACTSIRRRAGGSGTRAG